MFSADNQQGSPDGIFHRGSLNDCMLGFVSNKDTAMIQSGLCSDTEIQAEMT